MIPVTKNTSKPIADFRCEVVQNQLVASSIYRIRFHQPQLANQVQPGQFINIRVRENLIPLLRRPFSIHRSHPIEGWFEILFDIRGTGTKILTETLPGQSLSILGPLGNIFQIPLNLEKALIIAGGIGIAPMLFLAEILKNKKIDTECYYGVREASQFCCLDDFKATGATLKLATEDGGLGFKGYITHLLQSEFQRQAFLVKNTIIFACGPPAMLRAVQSFAIEKEIPAQLSLEAMMGCGFGVCVGCAVPVRKESGQDPQYHLVCQQGPIFKAEEVIIPD
ncbi:dihydroorotate dehydrogenase electron transfer subunit [candidate division KSB1 bacterium]|nr:dihydroorotate dehydrogenase electron transfer subunit [candidate division KSB1 bacterium]